MMMGVGEDEVLIQIRRAAEAGEVISAYEREYIEELVKKHLAEPEPEPPKPEPQAEPKLESSPQQPESAVAESPKPELQKAAPDPAPPTTGAKPEPPAAATGTFADHPAGITSFQLIPQSGTFFQRYKFLIIGGAAAAAIILGIALSAGMDTVDRPAVPSPIDPADLENTLNLDGSSYARGDIVSLHGMSTADVVFITIEDQDRQIVWTDVSDVRRDGTYSNMFIAGGPEWNDQEYLITAVHDTEETALTFDFAN